MQPPSLSVLDRNAEHFDRQSTLLIEPEQGSIPEELVGADILTFNYRTHNHYRSDSVSNVQFGLTDHTGKRYQSVVITMPKSKDELEFYLDLAEALCESNGHVYLVGHKKQGIAGGAKRLEARASSAVKLDSAKHSQLWQADGFNQRESLELESYFEVYEFPMDEAKLKLAALPGVFAKGRVDEGTQFLLAQRLKRLKGRVLDFGCGCGLISAFVKTLNPELVVEGVDINWLALKSAEKTFELNDLEGSFYASDGWSDVQGRVNAVITNPPFHQGVSTEYDTTETFIRRAYDKMARYAPMYIVANSFLRYPALIESVFGKCAYYARSTKFNIYYCER